MAAGMPADGVAEARGRLGEATGPTLVNQRYRLNLGAARGFDAA
jgi:hypothetical protein